MEYQHSNGCFRFRVDLPNGYGIVLQATSVTRERSGPHANVAVLVASPSNAEALSNGTPSKLSVSALSASAETRLTYDNLNLEKHEERVRLARGGFNSLSNQNQLALGEKGETILRHYIDDFCAGLWEAYCDSVFQPEEVSGTDSDDLKYILEPYVIDGGGTIIFAPPGRTKTWWGLLIAIAANNGIALFSGSCIETPVLFVNLERSAASLKRRIAAVNRLLGTGAALPLSVLNARGRSLRDVMPTIERFVAKHKIGLIVLDSISRAGYGKLVEDQAVNSMMDDLNRLAPSWLALAHTPRPSGDKEPDHVFGSQMFDAAADILIQLVTEMKDDGTTGVGLQVTKNNDGARIPLSVFALSFSSLGLLTDFRQASLKEFPLIAAKKKSSPEEAIREFILDQPFASATVTQMQTELDLSRPTIYAVLNSGHFLKVDPPPNAHKDKNRQWYGLKLLSVSAFTPQALL